MSEGGAEETDGTLTATVENVAITNQGPVVLLTTEDGEFDERVLPIFVSESQALAIQSALLGQMPPRVMTHDLFLNVLNDLGGIVSLVVVEELSMNTYFARLHVQVEKDGEEVEHKFDARPSDCIALAVRCNAPVQVTRDLMRQASIDRNDLQGFDRLDDEGEDDEGDIGDLGEFGGPEDIGP